MNANAIRTPCMIFVRPGREDVSPVVIRSLDTNNGSSVGFACGVVEISSVKLPKQVLSIAIYNFVERTYRKQSASLYARPRRPFAYPGYGCMTRSSSAHKQCVQRKNGIKPLLRNSRLPICYFVGLRAAADEAQPSVVYDHCERQCKRFDESRVRNTQQIAH